MFRLTRNVNCKDFTLGKTGDECVIIENIDNDLVKIKILKNEEIIVVSTDVLINAIK